jgi:hypothetical protein
MADERLCIFAATSGALQCTDTTHFLLPRSTLLKPRSISWRPHCGIPQLRSGFSEPVPFCRRDGVATIPLSDTIGADDTT